jgi:hypothetical protein
MGNWSLKLVKHMMNYEITWFVWELHIKIDGQSGFDYGYTNFF